MKTYKYCNNCGKQGHTFYSCKKPIISLGVIPFTITRGGEIKLLMICRKDSLGYVEFVRGKYPLYDKGYLTNIINEMSISEKNKLMEKSFDDLWTDLWGEFPSSQYKNEEERTFTLTSSQGKKHDDTFENILEQMKSEGPLEEVIGVLFRHGLMTYKIAMILSALESTDKKILCTDRIYDLSLKLVLEVFLDNALDQLKRMPKATVVSPSKHEKLSDALPKEFDRKKVIDLAKKISISQRSADGYVKILQDQGKIIKQKHGSYRKS